MRSGEDASVLGLGRAAVLLGVALGGFFDGILLHQILQWHHLLSDVQAAGLRDLRMQLLADGLFHLLMYLVALLALGMLWRHRKGLARPGAAAWLLGSVLVGFGLWHVLDAVLSHWLAGIHRIKDDTEHPLLWDLLWFVGFGLVPLAVGRWLRGRPAPPSGGDAGRRGAAVLAVLVLAAGMLAAAGPPADAPSVVVFGPSVSGSAAFDALAKADARVLWADRSGGVWLVQRSKQEPRWALLRSGAWLVGGTAGGWGCANWTTAM